MFVYNLTIASDLVVDTPLRAWINEVLLPEYLRPNFNEVTIFSVESHQKEMNSYAIHCVASSKESIDDYRKKNEKQVQSLLWELFEDRALSFSTCLQMISTENAKG